MALSIATIKSFLTKSSPQYVVLQLSPAGMFCALASIKTDALLIHMIEYTACTDNEITPTSIANPSKLLKMAHGFLDRFHQKPLPVMCFSALFNNMGCPPEHVLQHLLYLSKVNGPVIGLYSSTPLTSSIGNNTLLPLSLTALPNLIDHITPPSIKSWPHRLRRCLLIMLIPVCGISGYWLYKTHALNAVKREEKQLNDYMNKLKPRVHAVKELEKQNTLLKDRINTIKDLTEEQEVPADICRAIALHIPSNTWLTEIRIGQKLSNSKQANQHVAKELLSNTHISKIPFLIEGKTTDPDEVSIFLEALTTALPTSTLSIEHIARDRHEKQSAKPKKTAPYNFKLIGFIEPEE